MDVKVRCCPLGSPAADGSIILEEAVTQWLGSEDYKRLIEGKVGLGSLTHRIRSVETASDNVGNVGMLKKTIGKDDLGLIINESAPTFTHYVKEFFIDTYKGVRWLCADLHILDPDNFDHYAKENIMRLRALIKEKIRIPVSLVVVAYWSQEPGSHQDIAKKIKTIKSCDFTVNPSFGPDARIYEATDDSGKVIDSEEREYSIIEASNFNDLVSDDGKIKVKTFSDISGFDLKDSPKTSKIDGKFTTLKVKEFSCFGEVTLVSSDSSEQREFTQSSVRERLREAKMSPRMYFRRVYMSYSQVVKAMGGVSRMKEEDLKILKSMFTSDILWVLNQIQPEVLKGKQINTLLGCSSLSKSARQAAQTLQQPLRMAGIEVRKQGFLSKMRYQKLQDAYLEFIRSMIEGVFGPNPEPIKEEEGNDNNENEK